MSKPNYNYEMNDIEDKIILVTGSTDGIGKQSALEFAMLGAHVIIHGRDQNKLKKTFGEISSKSGSSKLDSVLADLTSFKQIHKMSDQLHKKYDRIDVLVNNAGVQMHEREISADGYEKTFAINHLAYFLLTSLLLDMVMKSDYKRILLTVSYMHTDYINFDNLQGEKEYSMYPIYSQSKLCNFLFGYRLAELLKNTGITVTCCHPGMVNTHLNPKRPADVVRRAIPVEQGSVSTVYAATATEMGGVTGKYLSQDASEIKSATISYDVDIQKKLWDLSEKLIGEKFKFPLPK